jgi:glycosyltransferase involved in cell wall biosynthesis
MPNYRIFHLIKSLGRGGAEILLEDGLRYSDRTHFTYGYGYFVPGKDALVSSLTAQGADVVCFSCRSPASMFLSVRRVARLLKQSNVDLLHCHLPLGGIIGRLAARIAGIPVIYTEHNVWERYHPVTRRVNLLTWKWQDAVIAVSQAIQRSIQAHVGNHVPVKVIHNGIDVDSFRFSPEARARVRAEIGIHPNAPVVGTVAVFRRQKRLDDWLRAAKIIKTRFPDTHFILVGDGPMKRELESRCASLGMTNSVHFIGYQTEVSRFLCPMDVFMNSSIFEGLPLAIAEAAAAGLPVVATAVGGVPEIVLNEQTGYLVPARQPEALAERVGRILSNPDLGKEFGRKGCQFVEKNFSIQRMIREMEELYTEVLTSNRTLQS